MVCWGILCNDRVVQEAEKHFVQDLGARSQHGTYQDDYEEGGRENDKSRIYKTSEMMKIG